MWCTSSLPLLPGHLWRGMAVFIRVLSKVSIVFDWNTWNHIIFKELLNMYSYLKHAVKRQTSELNNPTRVDVPQNQLIQCTVISCKIYFDKTFVSYYCWRGLIHPQFKVESYDVEVVATLVLTCRSCWSARNGTARHGSVRFGSCVSLVRWSSLVGRWSRDYHMCRPVFLCFFPRPRCFQIRGKRRWM